MCFLSILVLTSAKKVLVHSENNSFFMQAISFRNFREKLSPKHFDTLFGVPWTWGKDSRCPLSTIHGEWDVPSAETHPSKVILSEYVNEILGISILLSWVEICTIFPLQTLFLENKLSRLDYILCQEWIILNFLYT